MIDGKALRAAAEKIKDKKAPYIINALNAATNLMVAQIPIPEKTNEMGAIPRLLEILDITGSTVTIDAIGATKTILYMIQEKNGFFVQQVKKNCPATWQEIQDTFGKLGEEKEADPESLQRRTKGAIANTAAVKRTGNAWSTGKSDAAQTMARRERYGRSCLLYAASLPTVRCGYQKRPMKMGMTCPRIRKPS